MRNTFKSIHFDIKNGRAYALLDMDSTKDGPRKTSRTTLKALQEVFNIPHTVKSVNITFTDKVPNILGTEWKELVSSTMSTKWELGTMPKKRVKWITPLVRDWINNRWINGYGAQKRLFVSAKYKF